MTGPGYALGMKVIQATLMLVQMEFQKSECSFTLGVVKCFLTNWCYSNAGFQRVTQPFHPTGDCTVPLVDQSKRKAKDQPKPE